MADPSYPQPSWRKPAAIALIVVLIAAWAALIASAAAFIGQLPVIVQALFYLVAGIAWILPLGPVLRWSETGRWRKSH